MSEQLYLYLLLVFILAGFVKGVTGMGLPTVAMGLLGMFMPLPLAAALLFTGGSPEIIRHVISACWVI